MDVIIREHDISQSAQTETILLTSESMQAGLDKYVTDTITTVYGERLLAQIFRLNRTVFTNKDVQLTFKVGAQSARTRIQSWRMRAVYDSRALAPRKVRREESPPTNTPSPTLASNV